MKSDAKRAPDKVLYTGCDEADIEALVVCFRVRGHHQRADVNTAGLLQRAIR